MQFIHSIYTTILWPYVNTVASKICPLDGYTNIASMFFIKWSFIYLFPHKLNSYKFFHYLPIWFLIYFLIIYRLYIIRNILLLFIYRVNLWVLNFHLVSSSVASNICRKILKLYVLKKKSYIYYFITLSICQTISMFYFALILTYISFQCIN